jgi:hypothetical protein
MKKTGLLSVLFAVLGLGLIAGAVALALDTRAFIATAKHASGTVTELVPKRDKDDGSTTYTPVVMFEADSGASVSFTSSFSSNPPAYDVGEKVAVLYAPANPNEARIDGFGSLWLGPVIMGGIGTVFAAIGFGILFASRKRAGVMRETMGATIPRSGA